MIKLPNKNNPYYYEMKKISEGINLCSDIIKETEQQIEEFCVNNKEAKNEFHSLRDNTIKLCDNVSFIRTELNELIKKKNEVAQRTEQFEQKHQQIMKDNEDIMRLINMNYSNFFDNYRPSSEKSIIINSNQSKASMSSYSSNKMFLNLN